jgi:hypothetical protein
MAAGPKQDGSSYVAAQKRVQGLQLNVEVDTAFPDMWHRSPYYEQLKDRSSRMTVLVLVGNRRITVFPDKDIECNADEIVLAAETGSHIVMPLNKYKKLDETLIQLQEEYRLGQSEPVLRAKLCEFLGNKELGDRLIELLEERATRTNVSSISPQQSSWGDEGGAGWRG